MAFDHVQRSQEDFWNAAAIYDQVLSGMPDNGFSCFGRPDPRKIARQMKMSGCSVDNPHPENGRTLTAVTSRGLVLKGHNVDDELVCQWVFILVSRVGSRISVDRHKLACAYSDGTDHSDGASYLDLVEFLMQHGSDVEADLHELWRRIVISICASNTDDHLRNHGFLLEPEGWKLSPAYDINPNPDGTGLSLNISEADNSLNLDLAREVAEYFRLDQKQREAIIDQVTASVGQWRDAAEAMGISQFQQDQMARAFQG